MKSVIITIFIIVKLITASQTNNETKCPHIVSRMEWGARSATEVEYLLVPVQYVVIHHTVTNACTAEVECAELLTNMQTFHMADLNFHDIGYNFMIGGDGQIYEGVGWHKVGAHTCGYNTRSIGIAFIGNFNEKLPSRQQLDAAKNLLRCGVELGELNSRYKLIAGRQVTATQSPGLLLFREIQKWPNFAKI